MRDRIVHIGPNVVGRRTTHMSSEVASELLLLVIECLARVPVQFRTAEMWRRLSKSNYMDKLKLGKNLMSIEGGG